MLSEVLFGRLMHSLTSLCFSKNRKTIGRTPGYTLSNRQTSLCQRDLARISIAELVVRVSDRLRKCLYIAGKTLLKAEFK